VELVCARLSPGLLLPPLLSSRLLLLLSSLLPLSCCCSARVRCSILSLRAAPLLCSFLSPAAKNSAARRANSSSSCFASNTNSLPLPLLVAFEVLFALLLLEDGELEALSLVRAERGVVGLSAALAVRRRALLRGVVVFADAALPLALPNRLKDGGEEGESREPVDESVARCGLGERVCSCEEEEDGVRR
jgi:hypothetical protein